MIFDPEVELKNIEGQPEWIGVKEKITSLKKKRADLMANYEKYGNDKTLGLVDRVDEDIHLFQNIISFWILNYQKMQRLYDSFESSIKEINKGADQINLINDLKMAYNYERKENEILAQTFIDLVEKKGMDVKTMDKALNNLRHLVKDYLKHINKLLNG